MKFFRDIAKFLKLCIFFILSRIKKGNAQGHFDKFCYGFVTMNLPEPQALEVIARIGDEHPNWRLKIKEDGPSDQQRN